MTSRDHTAALDRDRHRRVKAGRSIGRPLSTAKDHECLRSGALHLSGRSGIMTGLLVALAVCSAPLAMARPTTPKPPTTIVKLQATGAVRMMPDLFESTLRSQHRAESAAGAQALVNSDIAAAIAMARDVKGVVVTTGTYNAWYLVRRGEGIWQAVQTIRLTGSNGPELMALIGKLQSADMVVSDMHWRLSRAQRKLAREQATVKALARLQAEALLVARTLHARFERFRKIELAMHPIPVPEATRLMAPTAENAESFVAPTSIAGVDTVSARVSADAVLAP